MSRKVKGFTLLELLVVIVILAIIALITVPIILNLIDESREKNDLNNAYSLIDAAKLYYGEKIYEDSAPVNINVLDELDFSGKKPDSGFVNFNKEGDVAVGLVFGKKCFSKGFNDSKLSSSNDIENCGGDVLIDSVGGIGTDTLNGLVPVSIADDGTVTEVDPIAGEWYDYSKKKWPNAVVLEDKSGGVSKDNIFAYYVWIPRYEYKDNLEPGPDNTKSVEINFIDKDVVTPSPGYIIPPAFTFGNQNLSGFWVAKFEPSSSDSNHGSDIICNSESCEPAKNVRILPGKTALTYITISKGFYLSRSLEQVYDINDDCHMMKNSEWAAVAYLSHSKYGRNAEVTRNSSYNLTTGGGAGDAYVLNKYQSTTGNISGIYDMAGGAWEYTMSSYKKDSTSGYAALSGFTEWPDLKYFDLMTNIDNNKGHAYSETLGWYYDDNTTITTEYPWVVRGGQYDGGFPGGVWDINAAGLFAVGYCQGSCTYETFRPVIAPSY